MPPRENSRLIHHKIADFTHNLHDGERFLPHLTTLYINHGFVIAQNFAVFRTDIHGVLSPASARTTTSIISRSSLTSTPP
ncbi:hypothetical protein QFY98_004819 [Escherichia coli]|nr:hypothetical protein [Escherichia coli]